MQMRVVTHIVCVSSLQSVGLHACHTRVMLRHARVLLYEPSYGLAQQWALSNLVERANDPEIQFFWLGLVFFGELRRFSFSYVRVCPCTWRFRRYWPHRHGHEGWTFSSAQLLSLPTPVDQRENTEPSKETDPDLNRKRFFNLFFFRTAVCSVILLMISQKASLISFLTDVH